MAGRRERRRRRQAKALLPTAELRRKDAMMLVRAANQLSDLTPRVSNQLRLRAFDLDRASVVGPIDDVWVRAIRQLFTDVGIESTTARSTHVAQIVGHPVAQLSDLTLREACAVVRSLEAIPKGSAA